MCSSFRICLRFVSYWLYCRQRLSINFFVGSASRTNTMHQVLIFKCKFPNHFAFTLGPYWFVHFFIQFMDERWEVGVKYKLGFVFPTPTPFSPNRKQDCINLESFSSELSLLYPKGTHSLILLYP